MLHGIFDIMQIPESTRSIDAFAEHLEDAVLADELGFDFYFSAERHFMPMYRTPAPGLWLASVIARTSRIRLGALAYTVPLHNPVRLAEEVSMLDHLSNGRLEVGVGVGHRPEELMAMGVDPRERELRMFEGLVLMQKAWQGEKFSFPGKLYQFSDVLVDSPVQEPHPPLWYAGTDPRAAHWAASNGLSLAIGFKGNDQLTGTSQTYVTRRAEKAAERDDSDARMPNLALMRHLYIAESDARARREMADDVRQIGTLLAASPRQMADQAPPKKLSKAEAEESVQEMIDRDIVIAGGPETVAKRLTETRDMLSLDAFLANPYLTGVEQERVQRTMRLFAEIGDMREQETPGS